ncbi:MAG: hypothetical protein WBN65_01440 [Gammaproteobacteria bacterium]
MWPNRARRCLICGVVAAGLMANAAFADDMRLMTEVELDQVTAGAASVTDLDDLMTFEAVRTTQRGKTVRVDGSLKLVESLPGITIGSLSLSDNAQSNLQSVININAVNSAVNVLLNLNVSIDSSVGAINQLNFNGMMPTPPPPQGP